MIKAGQVVLLPFPQIDQRTGKLRPALVLQRCPRVYNDWLICMISSQLDQQVSGIDELVTPSDEDFSATGLKRASIIRLTRLAVVNKEMLLGALGSIADNRLVRLKQTLANWILE